MPFNKLVRRLLLSAPKKLKKMFLPLRPVKLKKMDQFNPVKLGISRAKKISPASAKKFVPELVPPAFAKTISIYKKPAAAQRVAGTWPYADATSAVEPVPAGQFLAKLYTNHAGTRSYRLYVPTKVYGGLRPLIVMLHGCTQNADDFARGTLMNVIAGAEECFVAYPEQSLMANRHGCWNWFRKINQSYDKGEPSIIAGITQQLIMDCPIDSSRVYIAGLSAGGAMAVATAYLYPQLFAAVASHSGLPYASAGNLPSALTVMNTGMYSSGMEQMNQPSLSARPIIVFHGDQDRTVNPANAEQLILQFVTGINVGSGAAGDIHSSSRLGQVPGGHSYSVTSYVNQRGQSVGEYWRIHGAGHAWSGGTVAGTYTDPFGPDASKEMVRFFLSHTSG